MLLELVLDESRGPIGMLDRPFRVLLYFGSNALSIARDCLDQRQFGRLQLQSRGRPQRRDQQQAERGQRPERTLVARE